MTLAALSPSSVLATPAQINPQVRTDLLTSVPQSAQNAQQGAVAAQTDTVTISLHALKMSDNKNAVAKKTTGRDEARSLPRSPEESTPEQKELQENAKKAYAEVAAKK